MHTYVDFSQSQSPLIAVDSNKLAGLRILLPFSTPLPVERRFEANTKTCLERERDREKTKHEPLNLPANLSRIYLHFWVQMVNVTTLLRAEARVDY